MKRKPGWRFVYSYPTQPSGSRYSRRGSGYRRHVGICATYQHNLGGFGRFKTDCAGGVYWWHLQAKKRGENNQGQWHADGCTNFEATHKH